MTTKPWMMLLAVMAGWINREQSELIMLEPGEKRNYDLEFQVLSESGYVQEFRPIFKE